MYENKNKNLNEPIEILKNYKPMRPNSSNNKIKYYKENIN